MTDEDLIRAAIAETGAAIAAKDADGAIAHYAPDALLFGLAPPLATTTDRDAMAAWFATWQRIGHEARDVAVRVDGDLAVATGYIHLTGEKRHGPVEDMWFRITLVFERRDGRWLVVHEHGSVPFLMDGSDRAALDLKP